MFIQVTHVENGFSIEIEGCEVARVNNLAEVHAAGRILMDGARALRTNQSATYGDTTKVIPDWDDK